MRVFYLGEAAQHARPADHTVGLFVVRREDCDRAGALAGVFDRDPDRELGLCCRSGSAVDGDVGWCRERRDGEAGVAESVPDREER